MKTLRTRPKFTILNVRGLVLIYVLLIFLTVLFSRTFVSGLLEHGEYPGSVIMAVFFVIPAVLLVILLGSCIGIARDILAREPGSRFQIRLIAYFFIVVVLAAAPVTLITTLSVSELLRFWRTIDVSQAMSEAQRFAMETYSLNLDKLQKIAEETNYGDIINGRRNLPQSMLAVQDFRARDGIWADEFFTGRESLRMAAAPYRQRGFAPRELPRDNDVIRYIIMGGQDFIRVVTLDMGANFDSARRIIENEKNRFDIIDSIRFNINRLLLFYFGVFYLPALLMTIIIALSLSRRVSYPIEELTEATGRVAEGDFSIRILPRKGDELARLIRSFNSMVGKLEKSQAALLKNEKIIMWQDLAQRLAHEIKNPLTPIRLSAERVLRRWRNEPERIDEILENSMLSIIQEVEGLSTLLGDFRTLSRPMEITDAVTDLNETVKEIISSYSSSHPKIKYDTERLAIGIKIKMEKRRFSQVMTNLIINAIDAMDGSGLIEIRSDLVKKQEESYCRLSVRDTGKGIPRENVRDIFSPYFTTKESGTGLGLPIVERIVNDHGGAIWFDSGENAGTTFYIDLPLEKRQ